MNVDAHADNINILQTLIFVSQMNVDADNINILQTLIFESPDELWCWCR